MSREVVLTNGVKVLLTSVPSMLVLAATKRLREPEVPMWHNDAKDRDEPNPLDPSYIRAVEDFKTEQGELTTDIYIANGVQVLELPEDKYQLDDDAWIEGIEYIGLSVPRTGIGRRVAWLKWHVLGDGDLTEILSGIAIAGGVVTEEQVKQAADSFRDTQIQSTNNVVPITAEVRHGDTPTDNTRLSE